MKRLFSLLAVFFFLGSILASAAFAGGDNHRNRHEGDKGKGTVIKNKHQKR